MGSISWLDDLGRRSASEIRNGDLHRRVHLLRLVLGFLRFLCLHGTSPLCQAQRYPGVKTVLGFCAVHSLLRLEMADPFKVRMRFTSQLQHFNASVNSSQKAAHHALKCRDMDEDLHSCILEQRKIITVILFPAEGRILKVSG